MIDRREYLLSRIHNLAAFELRELREMLQTELSALDYSNPARLSYGLMLAKLNVLELNVPALNRFEKRRIIRIEI